MAAMQNPMWQDPINRAGKSRIPSGDLHEMWLSGFRTKVSRAPTSDGIQNKLINVAVFYNYHVSQYRRYRFAVSGVFGISSPHKTKKGCVLPLIVLI